MEENVQEAKQSASGLDFKLHPLVLINVSDHYTRSKLNAVDHSDSADCRVLGCLLGQQAGREVDISNSFEILYQITEGKVDINEAFMTKRLDQYKQVYPALDVVGWYATGGMQERDMDTHRRVMQLNESPVLLLLDPTPQPTHRDLPVRLFESEMHAKGGVPSLTFVQANFHIETSEAERIGVNQVAKILPSGKSSGSDQLTAHYQSIHAAVKMLISRIQTLQSLVAQMESGAIPYDHQLLRQAAALIRRLPVLDTPQFHDDYLAEYNDTMLTIYMASVTKGLSAVHDVIEKFNIAYDRSGPRRRQGV